MNIKEKAPHLLDLAWWNKSAKTLNSGQVIDGIEFLLTRWFPEAGEADTSPPDAHQLPTDAAEPSHHARHPPESGGRDKLRSHRSGFTG